MNRAQKLFIVAVFILAIGLWGLMSARASQDRSGVDNSLAASSFLPFDYIKEDASFRQELDNASIISKKWQSDAELVSISMKFKQGISYEVLDYYNYVFGSPMKPNQYRVISSPRVTDKKITQTTADNSLFNDMVPDLLDTKYLKINFAQALEIVERAGGSDFRVEHNGNTDVTLLLVKPNSGVMSWYVTYSSTGAKDITWQVNATSGFAQLQQE